MEIQYVTYLLGENRVDEAIDYIESMDMEQSIHKLLTVIKSRFSRLKKDIALGSISKSDEDLFSNKIVSSLIQLLEEYKKAQVTTKKNVNSASSLKVENLLLIDFSKFSPEFKNLYLEYGNYTTLQQFLNNLFVILNPEVPAFSYGSDWYIMIDNQPIYHKRQINMLDNYEDQRSLSEVGIEKGNRIEVISRDYLDSLFSNLSREFSIGITIEEKGMEIQVEASGMYSLIYVHEDLIRRKILDRNTRYLYHYHDSANSLNMNTRIGRLRTNTQVVISLLP